MHQKHVTILFTFTETMKHVPWDHRHCSLRWSPFAKMMTRFGLSDHFHRSDFVYGLLLTKGSKTYTFKMHRCFHGSLSVRVSPFHTGHFCPMSICLHDLVYSLLSFGGFLYRIVFWCGISSLSLFFFLVHGIFVWRLNCHTVVADSCGRWRQAKQYIYV